MENKTCILIAGMHRSGTSAIAGCYQQMGYNPGKELMPPTPDNPSGYFENIKCWQLNEKMLSMLNLKWDSIAQPNTDNIYIKDKIYLFEIEKIIAEDFLHAPNILIKDPRISYLLPYWIEGLEKLDYKIKIILPYRSPNHVCRSLHQRDGFSIEKSSLLYCKYMLESLNSIANHEYALINFVAFKSAPHEELKNINSTLDITPPIPVEKVSESIERFIDINLSKKNKDDLYHLLVPEFTQSVFKLLNNISPKASSDIERNKINAFYDSCNNLVQIKTFVDDELESFNRERDHDDSQIDFLNGLLGELKFNYKNIINEISDNLASYNLNQRNYLSESLSKIESDLKEEGFNQYNSILDEIKTTKYLMNSINNEQKNKKELELEENQKNTKISLENTIEKYRKERDNYIHEYTSLKNSYSSKIGFAITWPVRKIINMSAVLVTLLSMFRKSPKTFIKLISFENIKRVLYSMRTEPGHFLQENLSKKFSEIHMYEKMNSYFEENNILIHLDEAVLYFDELILRGWTLSKFEIDSLSLVLDNQVLDIDFNEHRPDVYAAFPKYPSDRPCGFNMSSELDALSSEIKIIVKDVNGNTLEINKELEIAEDFSYLSLSRQYEIFLKKIENTPVETVALENNPLISIIVPVFNVEQKWLDVCINSVLQQTYENWELCLYDDCSTSPETIECLQKWSTADPRIKIKRGENNIHISGASNAAAQMSTGEYIALLDNDDELSSDALYEVALCINKYGTVDYIYSDEDKIDIHGVRTHPHFKPDWSPETFESMMYVCHLSVIRKEIFNQVNGFRLGYEGSQDYDLVLRVVEKSKVIKHIPKILYHWRMLPSSVAMNSGSKNYAYSAAVRALSDALKRRNYEGKISKTKWLGLYRPMRKLKDTSVTILIPFKDEFEMTTKCIKSIKKSSFKNFKVILISNQSTDENFEKIEKVIKRDKRFSIEKYEAAFNYSKINNLFSKNVKSDFLLFLNNDTEVISNNWLETMLECGMNREVACVGAKLLYPDDTVQHAGVILGLGGIANHAFKGLDEKDPGYHGYAQVIRNYSAVTAACLLIRTEIFHEVGGFDEDNLPISYNDIDLCLRLIKLGYRHVVTPFAKLYHYESKSRAHSIEVMSVEERASFDKECAYFRDKWKKYYEEGDPYYNPNLTLNRENFALNI